MVLDQAVSSSQNLMYVILAAKAMAPDAFGRFSLLGIATLLVIGAAQSTIGDLAMLEVPRAGHESSLTRPLVQLTVKVSATIGAAILVGSLFFSGHIQEEIVALGLSLPLLVLTEVLRNLCAAHGFPGLALAADASWTGLWLVVVWIAEPREVSEHLYAYGTSSVVAIAAIGVGLWRKQVLTANRLGLTTEDLRKLLSLLREYGSVTIGGYAVTFGLGVTSGVLVVGALRAAQALLGPLNTLATAIRLAYSPALSRRSVSSTGQLSVRDVSVPVMSMTALASLGVALALWLPVSVGENILGATWVYAAPVLLFVSLQRLVTAPVLATSIALRVNDRLAWAAKIKSWYSIVTTAATLATDMVTDLRWALGVWILGSAAQTLHLIWGLARTAEFSQETVGVA